MINPDEIQKQIEHELFNLELSNINCKELFSSSFERVLCYQNGRKKKATIDELDFIMSGFSAYPTTIILPSAHRINKRINDASLIIEKILGRAIFANLYYSNSNSRTFPKHYDGHDVLALQLTGSKEWVLYEPIVDNAIDSKKITTEAKFISKITLNKNELLYIPRGLIHEVTSTADDSLHISFGVKHNFTCNIIKEQIELISYENPILRYDVAPQKNWQIQVIIRKHIMGMLKELEVEYTNNW